MEKDELKGWLAEGWSLEQIGRHVGKHPETVSYWVRKHGLKPNGRAKHAARGAISREELARAADEGLSIAELAELFNRSKGTVRHWMGRYGLKTKNRVGRRAFALEDGGEGDALYGTCERHGKVEFVPRPGGGVRCRKCRTESVSDRRRRVKAMLVSEAGGRCCICGYNGSPRALEFHHLDPKHKVRAVTSRNLALDAMRLEADKCVLLCSNCHAEVESGDTCVPDDVIETLRRKGRFGDSA